ncbi:MAG: TonB-dependent receptor plug domain-containing protein [Gammaproteobacteria bacterium]|nr:TonB-dependent receptor plug domain-containing protein [Gammaproteobacteria bacterium]
MALATGLTAVLLLTYLQTGFAQNPVTSDDATVTYPADFFAQFQPYSVNDMLQRIPGINLALGGGGGSAQGGPGSSGGGERRGLGAGGDQVLINGRRIAGKGNEGNAQLSRIPASEVQYIEIIRGTSGDLDVRGGRQVINIVLTEEEANTSYAFEVNMDYNHDDTFNPGSKLSATGQNGAFNYFLSAEIEPRYEYRDGFEVSIKPDGSLNQTVKRDQLRDAQPKSVVANFGYEFDPQNTANLNLQWVDNDFNFFTDRIITDFDGADSVVRLEHDDEPTTDGSWEIGGDYMHIFGDTSRWKTLFIVNEAEQSSIRDRYILGSDSRTNDLHLNNYERYRERIVRSSYIFDLFGDQSIEAGVEGAQTLLDTSLQLGLLDENEPGNPRFGGLSPVTDSIGHVEEMRYEYFAIHNWSINDRMTLETTLLFEDSTISQEGTLNNSRDFTFFRPKVDYRYDITPAVQFRATIEKDVMQLSFRDFTAGVDSSDDEQNAFEGNADLRQTQSWRYEANVEYRLPNDAGVINTNLFLHQFEDIIDNVDVSTEDQILSARGNIGDGQRYGINLNTSLRLNFINQPNMLLTSGLMLEEPSQIDPFTGLERERSIRGGGSNYRLGFRHDLPHLSNMNWGFNYRKEFYNDFLVWDIDKIEHYPKMGSYFGWFEFQSWANLVYRIELRDSRLRCRIRTRYINGTIANGDIDEIEDSCSDAGPVWAIKIRGTF